MPSAWSSFGFCSKTLSSPATFASMRWLTHRARLSSQWGPLRPVNKAADGVAEQGLATCPPSDRKA